MHGVDGASSPESGAIHQNWPAGELEQTKGNIYLPST